MWSKREINIVIQLFQEYNEIVDIKESPYPLLKFDKKSLSYLFFENKIHAGKPLRSFQFFDNRGNSVIKIYLKGSKVDEFESIYKKRKIDYNYELQEDIILNASSNNSTIDFSDEIGMSL